MLDKSDENELAEVLSQTTGAKFYRADLHIHSFGASHDVTDVTMSPDAIFETAIREGLSMIAITDHNEITNVDAARRASERTGVTLIPGIELSTPQGHLLCYLPTIEALMKFYARLSIADRGKPTSRCQQSILECLNLVGELSGFGVLAHVDSPSGFDVEVPGASPHKVDVICHPALRGMELKQATSLVSYGSGDPSSDRAAMGKERIRRLGLALQLLVFFEVSSLCGGLVGASPT